MKLSKPDHSVVRVDLDNSESPDILWAADLHVDSLDTYRSKIKKIFDQHSQAKIVVGSDFADLMQNTGDKRSTKGKDRYNVPEYINAVVDDLAAFFMPYAERIICFNMGNHELTQLKFYGVNIAQFIVNRINDLKGTNIQVNDTSGWIQLKTESVLQKIHTTLIYYSHRPISGGRRSKGILSSDIIAGQYPDADIYIHEHIHTSLIHPLSVEEINVRSGKRIKKNKWFIVMPTMKEEDQGARNSYHHQRNYEPTWIGMVLLKSKMVYISPRGSDTNIGHGSVIRYTPVYVGGN